MIRVCILRALVGLILFAPTGVGMPAAWSQSAPTAHDQAPAEIFSGRIEEIDRELHKVTVKTDVGREVAFPVKKPDLLSDLAKGDRVTVQLDDQHTAIKIMKVASIPELKQPPNPSP